MAKHQNIVEQLRRAMADSGKTLYEIAKGSGADYSVVLRFSSRERGISFETAAKLASYLELELRPTKAR